MFSPPAQPPDPEAAAGPAPADGVPAAAVAESERVDGEEAARQALALRASERRLQTLTDAAPVGMFQLDAGGACVYANERCAAHTGVPPHEAAGRGWARYVHPDDADRIRREAEEARRTGRPFRSEYRFVHPDGRVVWVYGQIVPETDDAGQVVGYVGTTTDITDRKRAEEDLRLSERRYYAVAEYSPVGISQMTMPDGRMRYMNPAMRVLLEVDADEAARGPTYDQFLTPEGVARMNAELAKRRLGVASGYEVEVVGRRGGRRTVLVSGAPVFGPDGTLQSVIGSFTDITRRRQTEQSLRESEARLRLLAERVPAILWTADAQLRMTSGMGAGLAAVSVRPDQFKGARLAELSDDPEWADGPAVRAHRRALAGEGVDYELKWVGRWYRCRVEPLASPGGGVTGVIGIALDITDNKRVEDELRDARDWLEFRVGERTDELKRANDALRREVDERKDVAEDLRQSQARYASILNSQQTLIARSDMQGRITYVNAAHQRTFGSKVGDSVFVMVHKDDVEPTQKAMATLAQPPYMCTLTQRCQVRGLWRTIQWQVGVIRDRMGQIIEYQGVGFDISALRQAEEMVRESERRAQDNADRARESAAQAVRALEEAREVAEFNRRLAREVDHRVRNNLAGLLGLVSAMKATAPSRDAEAFASAIEGRLLAMTHVNRLLAETNWQSVELRVLIASLLEAVKQLGCHPIPVKVEGPAVFVSPRQASPLSMILVEWFTNSCKYGAHSVEAGRLTVAWAIDRSADAARVRLHWVETGGPPIPGPVTPSLGTELVEGFAAVELRGKLELRFPEEGADHVLEFPLE